MTRFCVSVLCFLLLGVVVLSRQDIAVKEFETKIAPMPGAEDADVRRRRKDAMAASTGKRPKSRSSTSRRSSADVDVSANKKTAKQDKGKGNGTSGSDRGEEEWKEEQQHRQQRRRRPKSASHSAAQTQRGGGKDVRPKSAKGKAGSVRITARHASLMGPSVLERMKEMMKAQPETTIKLLAGTFDKLAEVAAEREEETNDMLWEVSSRQGSPLTSSIATTGLLGGDDLVEVVTTTVGASGALAGEARKKRGRRGSASKEPLVPQVSPVRRRPSTSITTSSGRTAGGRERTVVVGGGGEAGRTRDVTQGFTSPIPKRPTAPASASSSRRRGRPQTDARVVMVAGSGSGPGPGVPGAAVAQPPKKSADALRLASEVDKGARLSYDLLCKEGVSQMFPDATQIELMEFWSSIDPENSGHVTLTQVVRSLAKANEQEDIPALPDADAVTTHNRSRALPICAYDRPSSVLLSR